MQYPKPKFKKKKSKVKAWRDGRRKIVIPMFKNKRIFGCEICKFEFLRGNISKEEVLKNQYFLEFAHKFKRRYYNAKERRKLLFSFSHIIRICNFHHSLIEYDKELTKYYFKVLRGE